MLMFSEKCINNRVCNMVIINKFGIIKGFVL